MTNPSAETAGAQAARQGRDFERQVQDRLLELERDNRRLQRLWMSSVIVLAVLVGLGTALVLVSARHGLPGTVAGVVEARQFLLRDKEGAVRGGFGVLPDGTVRLTLQAPGSKATVTLTALKGGASGLTFTDTTGKARGVLGLLPDETMSLTFGDGTGMIRSSLGLNPEGSATLVFADKTGATRAGLGIDSRGAGTLTVVDRPGAKSAQSDAADAQEQSDDSAPPAAAPWPKRVK
jgi:hypothetical protein